MLSDEAAEGWVQTSNSGITRRFGRKLIFLAGETEWSDMVDNIQQMNYQYKPKPSHRCNREK